MPKYLIQRKIDKNNHILYELCGSEEIINKYDERGNLIYHKEWNNRSKEVIFEYYQKYDENNKLIRFCDIENLIKYQCEYDDKGRLIKKILPETQENYFYDENNHLIKVTDQDDKVLIIYENRRV